MPLTGCRKPCAMPLVSPTPTWAKAIEGTRPNKSASSTFIGPSVELARSWRSATSPPSPKFRRLLRAASRAILPPGKPARQRVSTFKAIRIDRTDTGTRAEYADFDESDLMEGDVTVAVTHSTVNYKDGLAITGRSPVVRRFPMIPGLDFAGTVEASSHPDHKPGDQV